MKLTKKTWIVVMLLGFIGQLAWMLENMYLNVYLFNELGGTSNDIAWMVALSAITATLTTIVMGSISDKIGKRKSLIVGGYLLWGLSVAGFTLINHDFISKLFPMFNVISISVFLLILWDCVMTFLGSTANDAAFNAWITDITTELERPKVESVLSILPLMAMLLIFGLLDPLTQNNQWSLFFGIIGVIVFVGGLVALLWMDETKGIPNNLSLRETIRFGFKSSTIKSNQRLYWSFILLLIVSIATQIWMPYLIIYIQKTLGIENYALILGVVLITASIISVVVGRLIRPQSQSNWMLIGVIVYTLGLVLMFFAQTTFLLIAGGTTLMAGNMILLTIINSLIRDFTPESSAGRFQGVRMIFGVMLPMIIGPAIGAFVISNSNQTYEELGVIKQVPTSMIFIASIIVLISIFIPMRQMWRKEYGAQ